MNPSEAVNPEEQESSAPESAETAAAGTAPVEEAAAPVMNAEDLPGEAAADQPAGADAPESAETAAETAPVEEAATPVMNAGDLPGDAAADQLAGADAPESAETTAETAPVEEAATPVMNAEDLLGEAANEQPTEAAAAEASLKALIEAVIYVTEEPLTVDQIANALDLSKERIGAILAQLMEEYAHPGRGITIREVAGGYKMGTKPEHHEAIRNFVKRMKPPLKLSIAALETLAVIAYKQPITAPEIMEIRGVQGAGVIKTLLDRKLIAIAGRKQVVGKPILYKTTKEFLLQFGLKDLAELPTLKEFEELRRLAFQDTEDMAPAEIEAPKPEGEAPPAVSVEETSQQPQAASEPEPGQSEAEPSPEPEQAAATSTE